MREIVASAKTVEEATEKACRELNCTREEVSVEILEMPVKKLFKNIPAKVKVTIIESEEPEEQKENVTEQTPVPEVKVIPEPVVKTEPEVLEQAALLPEEPEEEIDLLTNPMVKSAADYLVVIFETLGAENIKARAIRQGDATLLQIEGNKIEEKIEIKGETIQALSYLADRAVNKGIDKKDEEYLRIRLDVAGYRNRREAELIDLAKKVGKDVNKTKRSRTLAPMNPYERLIVHTTISQMDGLTSESIGSDTERRVVVKSTSPDATKGEDWKPQQRKPQQGKNFKSNRRKNDKYGSGRKGGGRPDRKTEGGAKTPEREYANRQKSKNAQPVVPDRREPVKEGEDLPLFGKIEL